MSTSAHTPSGGRHDVALLIYRKDRKGNFELLVRHEEPKKRGVYHVPSRASHPNEKTTDTAKRIGVESLGREIPASHLDYTRSAIAHSSNRDARASVFMVKATPQLEELTKMWRWRGWSYLFLPLNDYEGEVHLSSSVNATAASLIMLLQD
ncbi:hypothetical protein F4808DRAFT_473904 [Astrocystis sublimbata]|nr:hypothetical protein F4808DRAFT_473904 [Astrocystis sublimbata]